MEQLSLFSEPQEFKGISIDYPHVTFVKTQRTRKNEVFEDDDYYEVRYKNKPMFIFQMKPSGCDRRPISSTFKSIKTSWEFSGWGTQWLLEREMNMHIKSGIEKIEKGADE